MRFSLRSSSPIRTGISFDLNRQNVIARADAPRAFIVAAAHEVRFHQHSRLQPCGDARGHRRARIADRASPHAAAHAEPLAHPPRLDARRDVAPIAGRRRLATSRRRRRTRPRARSRSTPIPRRRRPALPRSSSHPRSAVRRRLERRRRQVARDEAELEIDSPHAITPASTIVRARVSPHRRDTSFGVAPTTMCSPSECTSDTPTVDVVRACTLCRHFFSALSGQSLQAQRQQFRRFPAGSRQIRTRWRTGPRLRRYPLDCACLATALGPIGSAPASNTTLTSEPVADAGRVPVDSGGIVGDRDEGARHAGCARADIGPALRQLGPMARVKNGRDQGRLRKFVNMKYYF